MYDRSRLTVVGRIIWFIVSLLIFIGLVWLVLWFFFWRSPEPTDTTSDQATSSQESKESGNENRSSSESASGTSGSSTSSDSSSTDSNSNGTTSSTSTEAPAQGTASSDSGTASSVDTATTSDSTATTSQADGELANVGPGSLVTPVAIAVVAGATYYHVRQRRRLLSE